jgi:hypothetical protein
MTLLFVALIAVLAIAVLIGVELTRHRKLRAPAVPKRTIPRRLPHLEDRIRSAFDGPREKHGDIFVSYSIWKRGHETRMELLAADPFAQVNEFTRCLIVRHLWRALESLAEGAVVVVDSPPQMWSAQIDEKFHDHGIDPWSNAPLFGGAIGAPQFAKE